MLLITLILAFVLIFQSGTFWTAYRVDSIEGKDSAKRMLAWSVATGLFGLYFMISMIGRAASL